MKNYLRFLSPVLLLLAVLMGGKSVAQTTEIYTFTEFTSATDVTFNGENCTITFSKNNGSTSPQWTSNQARLYPKGSISVSSKKKILKIVYNYVINKKSGVAPSITNVTPDGFNESTKTWSSETGSEKVTMTLGGTKGNFGFTSLEITYVDDDSRNKTSLTFPTSSYTFMVGEDIPVFSNKAVLEPAEATGGITYTSDNENIAVVIDGDVTVDTSVEGTATIKAEYKGNDKYAPSSATYTININKPTKIITSIADLKKELNNTSRNFTLKLTDAIVSYTYGERAYIQDATAGILLFTKGKDVPLTAGQKFNGFVNVAAQTYYSLPELTSWNPYSTMTTETTEELPLDVVTLEELKNNYDKYESCRVKVLGVTISKEFTDRTGEISQNGETISLRAGDNKITVTRNDIADIIGFPGVYKTANQLNIWEQSAISPITVESLTPAASGYATYAADYAVNYSKLGLTAYTVKVATDNSKVSATPFTGVVPAGKAVLVKGTAGLKYTLTPATTAADETFDTDLLASDSTVTADGTQHFAFGTKNGVSGFKLVKRGVVIPAKKGYLLISNAGAKEFFAFEGETTGISTVETTPATDGNVYNMAGQRVSKNYKGLVIVGGKKYLNK